MSISNCFQKDVQKRLQTPMRIARVIALTSLAMIAFAGNSVLCRMALKNTGMDAASFTSIRLASGAAVLWAITVFFRRGQQGGGNWLSAVGACRT